MPQEEMLTPPTVDPKKLAKVEPKLESRQRPAGGETKDPLREAVETVVFVVFLVLLLKAFVAEAFVIPTGSMATTLYGYHWDTECDQCGFGYSINASDEGGRGMRFRQVGAKVTTVCPNCRYQMNVPVAPVSGGDKVLVSKTEYDLFEPGRFDVVVFKFPGEAVDGGFRDQGPQRDFEAHNFIKRLVALPGETLAIWYGNIYLKKDNAGEQDDLHILRRPLDKMLEMRRAVYDNDHPAKDLASHVLPRWGATDENKTNWVPSKDGKSFSINAGVEDQSWLRYHHRVWPTDLRPDQILDPDELNRLRKVAAQPKLITDFLDYNSNTYNNWTGDLMVSFDVENARAEGELLIELSVGIDRHRAVFDLGTGRCRLQVLRKGEEVAADEAVTGIKSPGKHTIQFSNFDDRLTLWLDGQLVFGEGLEFQGRSGEQRGPTVADTRPVGIAARGAELKVDHLKIWRDIYYTQTVGHSDFVFRNAMFANGMENLAQLLSLSDSELARLNGPYARPRKWAELYGQRPMYYEIPEDEYFVLGDNSTRSNDSRGWGGVPSRLLLGKAVFVYWPPSRFGLIR